ncbi:inter-alpha-trypsin inhibitor-like isoform X2 [Scomber scombrus]|uniref:inter-alpha-trypsin inhibitor-like isoform X2 n=1 Tax=Scomber scombrus TaxID=13677 RepID=UPI002DD8A208|nr:inter-alpha-trypsin inhibitor-like isoform X2 [Scomber scombrus]
MVKAVILISVLVLGYTWTLQDVGTVELSVDPSELDSASDEDTSRNATEFNATETCTAAPVTGPCKARKPRYFYNSTSMTCQVFIYGGCGGNQNNFLTEKHCLKRCHSKEVCKEAPETGPCKARKMRYFYNSTLMRCEIFVYGGCSGNQNNFRTERQCMKKCHPKAN